MPITQLSHHHLAEIPIHRRVYLTDAVGISAIFSLCSYLANLVQIQIVTLFNSLMPELVFIVGISTAKSGSASIMEYILYLPKVITIESSPVTKTQTAKQPIHSTNSLEILMRLF